MPNGDTRLQADRSASPTMVNPQATAAVHHLRTATQAGSAAPSLPRINSSESRHLSDMPVISDEEPEGGPSGSSFASQVVSLGLQFVARAVGSLSCFCCSGVEDRHHLVVHLVAQLPALGAQLLPVAAAALRGPQLVRPAADIWRQSP